MNVKLLSVVWPQGIPTKDYEKLVDLIGAEPAAAEPRKVGRPKKQDGARQRVAAALSTGPATLAELAEATGYCRATVLDALSRVAVKIGTRANPSGWGIPANVYALKEE